MANEVRRARHAKAPQGGTVEFEGEELPTISEDDRRKIRNKLYNFAKKKLGTSDSRASYLADTYSLVSKS